ncbi:MAG: hypothetical protein U1F11_04755 [Steroidobacteraceae bacterium]
MRRCFRPGAAPRIAQIECRCDWALRRERLRERAAAALRHPGHRDAQAWQAFEPAGRPDAPGILDLDGLRLVYDSTAPDAAATQALLARLRAWCA